MHRSYLKSRFHKNKNKNFIHRGNIEGPNSHPVTIFTERFHVNKMLHSIIIDIFDWQRNYHQGIFQITIEGSSP